MKFKYAKPAALLLDDGTYLTGSAVGKIGTSTGEICFNTGMTGYQEIYTDPSYYGQIIINTLPHLGNYGSKLLEQESKRVQFNGLVCKNFSEIYSRETADSSLQDYLVDAGITGIADIDTRMLVRHIRNKGAMNAIVSSEELDKDRLADRLARVPSMAGLELSSEVSIKETVEFGDVNADLRIAVLDLGIKKSILRNFTERGASYKMFPARTSFAEMEKYAPHGYFISNGPGDPAPMDYATDTVKEILNAQRPMFGICLGHQILAQAVGVKTFKMHNGHRGLNHPVKNLRTGKSEITSQNHGFGVEEGSVKSAGNVEVTHLNLNDGSIEGISLKDRAAFSVQYHPESCPGTHDSSYLFDQFLKTINN